MQVVNMGKDGDVSFRNGDESVVIIDQHIDTLTFYRNGVLEVSLTQGKTMYIDLDKLREMYPKK